MNIGIVCYPTFGGSGVVATELGKALAKKGHRVHFMAYNLPFRLNPFSENLFYHEVSVNDYPLFEYQPYESALASKIVDVAMYERLDVLHVHYAIPHASVAYLAQQILKSKKIFLPYITTLHGTDITLVGRDPSFEPVIRFSLNNSNAITSVSESLKKDTLSTFKIDNKIDVIPNFINLEDYTKKDNSCERKHYAPNGEKIMVHVSNFRKVKRVEDVLKVFDKVRKAVPTKLILVGDGPERPAIEKLCRELDTCKDIISLGRINNPTEVLSMADLFILPSETESFGLAALEAMAMQIPVISTNTGGLPEVNINEVTGYLSDVGDVDDMTNNSIKLLSDEKLLAKFKSNAFEQAKKFDINNVLPLYEKLYQKVISKELV
ncbi:MAG TPA: N-acetyl-alpha-D-glucosaminyl L-malate synthase BshA [Bacteroidia bacterium]|jgi:N-acetyl-alpha-D-glucosaminyl L-malate synthase BshA|nr:N-acetyl-alpha-D-glucosaminyl L-malate synthase BshA [Bacteroidia bacterium]